MLILLARKKTLFLILIIMKSKPKTERKKFNSTQKLEGQKAVIMKRITPDKFRAIKIDIWSPEFMTRRKTLLKNKNDSYILIYEQRT